MLFKSSPIPAKDLSIFDSNLVLGLIDDQDLAVLNQYKSEQPVSKLWEQSWGFQNFQCLAFILGNFYFMPFICTGVCLSFFFSNQINVIGGKQSKMHCSSNYAKLTKSNQTKTSYKCKYCYLFIFNTMLLFIHT